MKGTTKAVVVSAALIVGLSVSGCNRRSATETTTTTNTDVASTKGAPGAGDASAIDSAFLVEAAKGDFGETQIGKLAQERATTDAGKEYGRMLERDHSAHRQLLAALATRAGVTLRDEATEEGQRNYEKLQGLRGPAFDREFGKLMRDDHRKDIEKYQQQAANGPTETAALARETIPTLQHHLEMAQKL